MEEQFAENREALVSSCKLLDLEVIADNAENSKLEAALATYLNELVVEDFNKLIGILYRIDISEEKAVAALANAPEKESAGETLAKLIILRQKEKIYFRKLYSR